MSKLFHRSVVLLALAFAAGALSAQPASGPAAGASVPARGPGMGMGMGMGPGKGAGMGPGMGPGRGAMGPRFGAGITPGWSLMTPEERNAHRATMQGMKSADECRAYVQKHHEEMAQRAKERGQALPGPRRDVCAGLKP